MAKPGSFWSWTTRPLLWNPSFPSGQLSLRANHLTPSFLSAPGWARISFSPQVEQGYYSFRDRYAEQYPDDTHPLLQRFSYNYTAALYDTENSTLYYYELDT